MNIWAVVIWPFQCIKVLYKRIQDDRVLETASSLTYQTILALVPLFAVILGIAKGFSLDTFLETVLLKEFGEHREILQHLLTFSKTTLEQMKGGLIMGIGVLFLLITTTNLLSTTEDAMNRMWGVLSGRSLARRVADFQSCLFLFPLLLVVGSSATLFIQTTLSDWSGGVVEPFVMKVVRFLPLISLWALFTLSYWLIPYVPVKKRYALVTAAFMTGAFHMLQIWYIELQLTLTKISVIYGSFAALPLFLVWLYLSWILFLVGSELLVFLQEKGWQKKMLEWKDSETSSLLAEIHLFREVVHCYEIGKVYSLSEHKKALHIPMRAKTRIVRVLEEKKMIHRFSEGRVNLFLIPSHKGLKSGIGEIILPSAEHVEDEDRQKIERWRSLLNEEG
jgi:membrane protein